MVGTRGGIKYGGTSGRSSLLARLSRKSSLGALEEPEDEIFWDSDEVKTEEYTISEPRVNVSSATDIIAPIVIAPTTAPMTKNKKNKGKGSPKVPPSSSLGHENDQAGEPFLATEQSNKESFSNGVNNSSPSQSKAITSPDKSATKFSPTGKTCVSVSKSKSLSSQNKNCTGKTLNLARGKKKEVIDTYSTSMTSQKINTGNFSGSMKKQNKMKKEVVETKREVEDIPNPDSDEKDHDEDPDEEEEGDEEEMEYNDGPQEGEEISLRSGDLDESKGLRRSSRRSGFRRRPSWLVRPRRLRGYPSPAPSKEKPDERFVEDSEEHSEDDMMYPVRSPGRPRHRRLPRRYQEDTEEEEEISRGPGRPRGTKGHCRRPHLGATTSSATVRRRAVAAAAPSPRRRRHPKRDILLTDDEHEQVIRPRALRPRNVRRRLAGGAAEDCYVEATDTEAEEYTVRLTRRSVSTPSTSSQKPIKQSPPPSRLRQRSKKKHKSDDDDDDRAAEEEEQEASQEEEEEEEGNQEEIKNEDPPDPSRREIEEVSPKTANSSPSSVVRGKRVRACMVVLTDKEATEEEEETEDEQPRRPKTRLDPVLRNEDCVEYAKSVNSYSNKKRTRQPVKRLSYSSNNPDQNCDKSSSSSSSSSSSDSDDEDKGYALRRSNRMQTRPLTHSFNRNAGGRPGRHRKRVPTFLGSPARKPFNFKRRTTHNKSSSSTSSDGAGGGGSGDDEREFEKRRARSNAKARGQLLPMNLTEDDLQRGIIKERSKVGSSLADVEPMSVERDVVFSSVGGLDSHVRSLREMVVLPLLYPEVFTKFAVTPPRGVLFYGPPGTGKTLVARALANECSMGDKKVAFFMRKGADCLSKWVGESERQLRLLFDQAYQMRPSIIFFDEIDGLAPVRSSRQDQIHSSIVSTLLALMDGLDSRGEIIIIGATNRIEAIDPALRRPGRFDRELCFPLPSAKARQQILSVHTSKWLPQPSVRLLKHLSEQTSGYCGADIKSLCCEAVLASLRARYPQVYHSTAKLQLDVDAMTIRLRHFQVALNRIVPAGQRSRGSVGVRLHPDVRPLLQRSLQNVLKKLAMVFPQGLAPAIGQRRLVHSSISYRPRLLLSGTPGQGQSSHLGPALLHALERVPSHKLDLAALYSNASRTPEEAVTQVVHEACSRPPSIIYLPHLDRWIQSAPVSVRATFLALLEDISPSAPVLLFATTSTAPDLMPDEATEMFSTYREEVITMTNPTKEERREYFKPLFYTHMIKHKKAVVRRRRSLTPLPLAAMVNEPRQLSEKELQRLVELEEATLRELRIFLRQICTKLARNRQFCIFSQPVDVETVPDYLDIISKPMDLETMMTKIDRHEYTCAQDFLKDIDLICANALEYNPNHSSEDQHIRHTACALRDTAYTLIKTEMDTDFEDKCQGIRKFRNNRNTKIEEAVVPEFVYTQPLPSHNGAACNGNGSNSSSSSTSGIKRRTSAPVQPSSTGGDSSKKRKKRTSWSCGIIKKPTKKPHLEKTSNEIKEDRAKHDSKQDEDDIDFDQELGNMDESVRDVHSTSTLEICAAEQCAQDLCNGDLSPEESSGGDIITAPPLQSTRASSSSTARQAADLPPPFGSRRRSSAGSTASPGSRRPSAAMAEHDDVTVSSSERDENSAQSDGLVDWSHLDAAYGNCVSATADATLSQLQQLHTTLTRLVRTHAATRDKTQLLQDTEAEIRKFVQFKNHV